MKHFYILTITILFLAGCGRSIHSGKHIDPPLPVEIKKDVPVKITGEVTVPPKDHIGQSVLTEADTTITWDWADASTQVSITRKDSVPNFILVKTRIKEVKIPVTLYDTVTVVLRDTVKQHCPEQPSISPAPPPGSGPAKWLFWGFGVIAAILYAVFAAKKKTDA